VLATATEDGAVEFGIEDLLKFYYYLRLARGLEERVIKLYRQGRIVGGAYVGTGEEAIPVGSACALEPDDVIAPSHRDLGAHLVKGITPKEYMAQYLGRRTGLTRGKDGNVHFGDLRRGLIGFISPMADGIPVATGAALAFKIRREPRIAVAYFGDGASSRGDFHEGLNLAAVLTLPVLYICHNNQYAYSVPVSRQMVVSHVADRAKAYGLPTQIIDGNDVLAVAHATREAAARARSGGGHSFIECKTMRMRGHAEHDDASYVPRELLEEWRRRDPIQCFEGYLHERNVPEERLRAVEARVHTEIEEAVDFAEKSPPPDASEALEGVFAV
jgi:pyruvate dehydrogenase E1 component alpha subunit